MNDTQGRTIIFAHEVPDTDAALRDLKSSVAMLYELSLDPAALELLVPDIGVVAESALALNLVFGRLKQSESTRLVHALTAAE